MSHLVPAARSTTLVFLALVVLALSGCPESHGMPGTDAGTPARDGSLPIDAPAADGSLPLSDAPAPGPDSSFPLPDAPGSCPTGSFDGFCTTTSNAAVPAGVAYDLEVFLGTIDGCFCGEEIDCTGSIGSDGGLYLTAAICTDSVCDACLLRTTGICHLPALPEGTYAVTLNGVRSFELTASNVTPLVPVDTCVTTPRGGCAPLWPPVAMDVQSACVDTTRTGVGSPIPVEVVNNCGSCAAAIGPCVTVQTGPTTFEVIPQELSAGCDIACPAICEEVRHTCWLPALDAGTYGVRVRGIDSTMSVVVGDPTGGVRTCVGSLTGG